MIPYNPFEHPTVQEYYITHQAKGYSTHQYHDGWWSAIDNDNIVYLFYRFELRQEWVGRIYHHTDGIDIDDNTYFNTSTNTWHPLPYPKTNEITNKESNMKKALSTQLEANKDAAILAGRIVAGKAINKRLIKTLKPKAPMMVRGYMDHPLASVAIANAVGIAMKQFMPDSKKANTVADLMLEGAALELAESFNLEEILESIIEGVKLPEEVTDAE